MSEKQHTPGPWRIAGKGTVRHGDTDWIASVNWFNRDANARLIAAAPDLLVACQQLVACQSGLPMTGIQAEQYLQDALAAIAEATTPARNTSQIGEG